MSLFTLSCPACGGRIENLEAGKDKYFCPYCGNVIAKEKAEASKPTPTSLVIRGNQYLESRDWNEAGRYFDRALDIDPSCVEAYLGKVHAAYFFRNRQEALDSDIIFTEDTGRGPWFRYAVQYAGETGRDLIEPYISSERLERIKADKDRETAARNAANRTARIAELKQKIESSRREIEKARVRIPKLKNGIASVNARTYAVAAVKVVGFAAVWLVIWKFLGRYDSATAGFTTALPIVFAASLAGLIFWCVRGFRAASTDLSAYCGRYSSGQKMYKTRPQMESMLKEYESQIRTYSDAIKSAQEELKGLEGRG